MMSAFGNCISSEFCGSAIGNRINNKFELCRINWLPSCLLCLYKGLIEVNRQHLLHLSTSWMQPRQMLPDDSDGKMNLQETKETKVCPIRTILTSVLNQMTRLLNQWSYSKLWSRVMPSHFPFPKSITQQYETPDREEVKADQRRCSQVPTNSTVDS